MAENNENMEEQFLSELHWCITQLELGLETQNPNSRQAREAEKALKVLCSSRAPVVKKRTVMRNVFGDYRQNIREAEKRSALKMKQAKMSPALNKEVNKSVFYKKSSYKQSEGLLQTSSEQSGASETARQPKHLELGATSVEKGDDLETRVTEAGDFNTLTADVSDKLDRFSFTSTDNNFKFNFQVSDPTDTSDGLCEEVKETDTTVNSNNFKMEKSDNSFRFNFTCSS